MPRIPIITAQRAPSQLALPRPTEEQFGGQIEQPLAQFGQRLMQLASILQDQQDDVKFSQLQGDWRAGIAKINADLAQNPDYPTERGRAMFRERVGQLENKMRQTITRGPVHQAFNRLVNQTRPQAMIDAESQRLTIVNDSLIADLDREEQERSREFGETDDPNLRNKIIDKFFSDVAKRASSGVISQQNAQARRDRFEQRSIAERMQFLRRAVDVNGMSRRPELYAEYARGAFNRLDPSVRLNIIEQAQRDDERVEKKNEQLIRLKKAELFSAIAARANLGDLSPEDEELLASGRFPFIEAEDGRRLVQWNRNPIGGGDTMLVRRRRDTYLAGPRSIERVKKAMDEAKQLLHQFDKPNKELTSWMDELQSDLQQSETNIHKALNDDIIFAERLYDQAWARPGLVSMMREFIRVRRERVVADISVTLTRAYRKGDRPDVQKIVNEKFQEMQQQFGTAESILQQPSDVQRFSDAIAERELRGQ